MFATISPLIARGVIDNTLRDLIDLRLWFIDNSEPLHLRMRGNCLQDIAGCRVEFTHIAAGSPPQEMPAFIHELRRLAGSADFTTGDMTFSRRVLEKNNRGGISNLLYIEFFVNTTVRVLVELEAVRFNISLPQWEQSWEGNNLQHLLNLEAMRAHVQTHVRRFRGPALAGLGEDMPPCDWDYRLNHAEACVALYSTIHAKYGPVPGGYLSAAYVYNLTDFLNKLATEEEADMPPDAETMSRDWDVVDFMAPYENNLRRAMHHSLFAVASHMTALVQEHILRANTPANHETSDFLALYATIITHLLSTIMLTEEEHYNAALAAERMEALCRRLSRLAGMLDKLPDKGRASLQEAAETLMHSMRLFIATIPG